jgi:hypothetical protein
MHPHTYAHPHICTPTHMHTHTYAPIHAKSSIKPGPETCTSTSKIKVAGNFTERLNELELGILCTFKTQMASVGRKLRS